MMKFDLELKAVAGKEVDVETFLEEINVEFQKDFLLGDVFFIEELHFSMFINEDVLWVRESPVGYIMGWM